MASYTQPILTALAAFPFIALLMTVPYIIMQYRRYGAVLTLRVVIVYSFVLYLMCVYFLVILPLPARDIVAASPAKPPQLIPFRFIIDFVNKSGLVLSEPSTYLKALKSLEFLTVMSNFVMFLPLGIYLRYYFKRKFKGTLIIAFLTSLFLELTQLSGLYGIYTHAYRMFDVDDLFINTLGALLGFAIAPLAEKLLPSRDKLDEKAYERSSRVTLTRRLVAAFLDWVVITPFLMAPLFTSRLSGAMSEPAAFSLLYIALVFIFFVLIPTITKGYTLGKFIVKIRLSKDGSTPPHFYNYLLRYTLLYVVIMPASIWGALFLSMNLTGIMAFVAVIVFIGCLLINFTFVIRYFKTGLSGENKFLYEKLSGIKNVSSFVKPEKTAQNDELNEKN